MDTEGDNYEVIYSDDDDEYRVYCYVCDKLCMERYYKNLLESQIHTNIFYKKQQLKKSFQIFSFI